MKKNLFFAAVAFLIGACKSSELVQPELNINYPAAYVVNGESSSISVINLNTNEVAETIPLAKESSGGHGGHSSSSTSVVTWPHHIYVSPDKSSLAVGVPGVDLSGGHVAAEHAGATGKVVVLDALKGQNRTVFETPFMNHNAVFSADSKEIWTTQMAENGTVLVYDATTYALKNTIKVGKEPAEVTFSADGSTVFVANGADGSVTAINPNSKLVLATIAVGKNPVGAWVGADNRMYVDNEDGQTVSIIDVKTRQVVETVALGFMPGYVAYQADAKEMWVTDPTSGKVHYWTKGANGKFTKTGSFATAAGAHAIAFNGTTAYVTNQEAASVSVIDVLKHQKIKDLTVGKKPNGLVIKM